MSISRHGFNQEVNNKIMNLQIQANKIAHVWKQLTNDEMPKLRWVCVI